MIFLILSFLIGALIGTSVTTLLFTVLKKKTIFDSNNRVGLIDLNLELVNKKNISITVEVEEIAKSEICGAPLSKLRTINIILPDKMNYSNSNKILIRRKINSFISKQWFVSNTIRWIEIDSLSKRRDDKINKILK